MAAFTSCEEEEDFPKDPSTHFKVSEISPLVAEKCGERDALRGTYKMKAGNDESQADMTIWFDPSTGFPVKRRMAFKVLGVTTTTIEEYATFKLDEPIDPKMFTIPEKK